jgi:hypothetical protein
MKFVMATRQPGPLKISGEAQVSKVHPNAGLATEPDVEIAMLVPKIASCSPPRALQVHICPHCGASMRLVSVQPGTRYTNLDRWSYRCECGEGTEDIIPNKN